ncbi:DUF7507 domain-containing protein [Leptothermofonsia sp. ETS-13]|uniref:DUF7507 domain-containing protein n=1 Tax=Leptothermofonsia sp. ETS-13 TaxID=3035696 RepID=UPI003B9F80C2
MSLLKRPLVWGRVRFLLVGLLLGWPSVQGLPILAQQIITIPNTATANLQGPSGNPVNVQSNQTTITATIGRAGLEIIKTADRASAEPGDTVVYRLLVRNTGDVTLNTLQVTDTLPFGVRFLSDSPRASLTNQNRTVSVSLSSTTVNGRNVVFGFSRLEPRQVLTIVYGVVLTPDAIRGNGRNIAVATGLTPAGTQVSSASASYLVQIRPGILSDCGTILGRVFVDRNFDGEQQPGEPGVPNAVIYMDDGNRITTDANGLFSLSYVVAGYRTGTLDLTSLPGYTLAPNLYRIEGNSQSRFVKLAPGGLAKMNFAVTPTFKEGQR